MDDDIDPSFRLGWDSLRLSSVRSPLDNRDQRARISEFQERMGDRMDSDGESFTVFTQIEIGAVRMHALVPDTNDILIAAVAGGKMMSRLMAAKQKVLWIRHFDKRMRRVLLRSDSKTLFTSIEIGTVRAFIACSDDPRIAKITSSIVERDRLGPLDRNVRRVEFNPRLSFDPQEVVVRMGGSSVANATVTQIIIWTVQALESIASDTLLASIADNTRMDSTYRRSHLPTGRRRA